MRCASVFLYIVTPTFTDFVETCVAVLRLQANKKKTFIQTKLAHINKLDKLSRYSLLLNDNPRNITNRTI